jgi:hypothetical protein
MFHKLYLPLLAIIWLPLAVHGRVNEPQAAVQIRAVLHDPMHPVAELYFIDKDGEAQRLDFRPKAFSRPFTTMPLDGSLVLYDKAEIDPEKPTAGLAASVKLSEGIRRAIVVVVPAPEGKKPAYRILVIDDSEEAFPGGESLVLPLIRANMVIQAGEHTVPVHPGKLAIVPSVEEKNDFNMAQTNFHYQNGDKWVTFAERQLQFLEASRRLFIIDVTPGALQPRVTTIMDVKRAGEWR